MGCYADIACCRDTACSRERFFVGTRKTDDGERSPGVRGTTRSPASFSHRRGGLTTYPASIHAQGARGAPWTPGIRGTAESFVDYAGSMQTFAPFALLFP